jgi:hypothetical protein
MIIITMVMMMMMIIETYKEGKPCHCPRQECIEGTVEFSLHSLFNLGAKG